MEPFDTIDYRGYTIEVHTDDHAMNPRTDYDNFGHMVCWHRRYDLGDEQPDCTPTEYLLSLLPENTQSWLEEKWDREHEKLWERLEAADVSYGSGRHLRASDELDHEQAIELDHHLDKHGIVRLPLYLYDHSGITMSTGPFSCPWDSGQVGFIYVTYPEIRKAFLRQRVTQAVMDRALALLRSEVKEYDYYIRGAVYGYTITDPDGEEIDDSCWGFYGYDHEKSGLKEEAEGAIDFEIEDRRKEHQAKAKELIRHHVPLEVRQSQLHNVHP